MTSGANGEWVRQGTPHDDNADWNEEQSEYGTAMSPTEWDDYSSEQSVPVAPPRPQADNGSPTAASPASPSQPASEPVPGQEPYAAPDYRSDGGQWLGDDGTAGDADDHGMEPAPIDEYPVVADATDAPVEAVSQPEDDEWFTQENDDEVTRPRPIVSDAPMADFPEAMPEALLTDQGSDAAGLETAERAEGHLDAAEYLAVDPVSADALQDAHVDVQEAHEDTTDTDRVVMDEDDAVVVPLVAHDESTAIANHDDDDATQAMPLAAAGAGGAAMAATAPGGTAPDGLYRADGNEQTAVIAQDQYPGTDADVEEERRQAELNAERQAREQRLGAVPTSSENAVREDFGPPRVTTDRFFPSFGLFVLRIVVAGVLGFTSYQILGSGVGSTTDFLSNYPLIPEPRLVAWILGFTLGAMALLLIIGMLQRVVGFLLLAIAVASLVFIRWGNFAIFNAGTEGFLGDKDLLLAAIGLVLFSIGGGAWGIDGAWRKARADARAERQG